jgi:excinuclease ABC subunit A
LPRSCSSDYRGQHIGLLAPLVVNRKGVYTELADWARPRGYTHLRVDGGFLPTTGFPRIDRFKEHTIELPVWSLDVTPANENELRDKLCRGPGARQGRGARAGARRRKPGGGVLHPRACPVCSTSYAELDPRLFSYNSKHGWCPDCVGTGVRLTREQRKAFDDTIRDDDSKGREQTFAEPEVEDVTDEACATCHGARLNLQARSVKFAGVGITDIAQLSVHDVRAWVQTLQIEGAERARGRHCARPDPRDPQPA